MAYSESIFARQKCFQQVFQGKATSLLATTNYSPKEVLLDILVTFYDNLKGKNEKHDKFVSGFLEKFEPFVAHIKNLRVTIDDFNIERIIGRGHFGLVKLVREKSSGDVYAMKVLKKDDILASQDLTFYEEERNIMAQAASSWITRLHYAFQDSQHLCLVMDYHPGGDLLGLLEKCDRALGEDLTRFYMAELTLAIDSLHKMGFAHRDIKPENILFDRFGHLKLADFGSAARINQDGSITSSMPVGTLYYIAPEVLQCTESFIGAEQSKGYQASCDYWSLGIVGYEMLYGCTPFDSESKVGQISKIMNHRENLVFPEDDNVSDHFKNLLKCLLCDANVRYGRKEIETHPFFLSIQWDNIQNMTPEYIPVVSSRDDTSNFEHFDSEARIEGRFGKKDSKDTLEKNLPFIGFTFTRNEGSLNDVLSPAKLKENVKPRRKTLVAVNVQVESESTEKTPNSNAVDYASRISAEVRKSRQKDEEIKKLRQKNSELEKQRREASIEMQRLASALEREQLDRAANESLSLEKIRDLKDHLSKIYSGKVKEAIENYELYREKCCILEEEKVKAEENLVALRKNLDYETSQHKKLQKKYEDDIRRYKTSRRSILDTSIASGPTPSVVEFQSNELKSKLEAAEEELNNQRIQNGLLMKKVEELNEELEFVIAEKESLVQDMDSELSDKDAQHQVLVILGEENKELKLRVKDLEAQKESATEKYLTCSSQCHKLKVEVEILQRSMNDLSSSMSSQKTSEIEEKLKEQIDDLSDQLLRSCEECKTLKEKVKVLEKEMQLKSEQILNRKEQKNEAEKKGNDELLKLRKDVEKLSCELSAAKLDIMSRDKRLETSRETHHFLREEKRRAAQEVAEKNKEINSMTTKIAALQSNIQRLEDTIKEKDITTKVIEENKNKENERLQALLEAEQKKVEVVKDLKNELIKVKDELRVANRQKSTLNEEIASTNYKIKAAVDDKRAAQEEILRLTKEIETIKQHRENLKVAALELDAENEDQYKTIGSLKEEIKELIDRSSQHTEDMNKLKEELRKARVSINEEKSLRIFHEKKIKELEYNLTSTEKDSEAEIICLKTSNQELRQTVNRLSSENDQLKMTVLERSNDIDDLNQDLDANLKDTVRIKEELSKVYTKLNALQEQNSEYKESLELAIRKGEEYKEKCNELQLDIQDQIQYNKEREVRDEAIMGQHVKLIDFLKSQLEQPKKKSGLMDKIFGSKDGLKSPYAPIANKEMECLLKRKDQRIKELEEKLNKLSSQSNPGNEGGILKRHTDSECDRKTGEKGGSLKKSGRDNIASAKSAYGVPSLVTQPPPKPQRLGQEVPHKFEQRMNTGAVRCQVCRKIVPIGEYVNSCKECKFTAHTQCAVKVPANCDFYSLRAEESSTASDVLTSDSSMRTGTAGNVEGWIKVPKLGRSRWEEKYLRFEGQKLCMYDQEPSEGLKPVTCLDLCSESHRIYVVPAVELAEVSYCAESDLPFVFKIETKSLTSCFPSHTLYFLTSSHEEKKRWITGFQYACNLHRVSSASLEDRKKALSNCCRTLMTLNSNKIEIHCAVSIGEATVIGTSLGLYAITETSSNPYLIDVGGPVYQIVVIPEIKVAVMITGQNRVVAKCSYTALKEIALSGVSNGKLNLCEIRHLTDCHLISAKMLEKIGRDGKAFLLAADPDSVSVSEWSEPDRCFTLKKKIKTSKACRCIDFSAQSAILGCEKLIEVDLNNLKVEAFLNANDPSLEPYIFKSNNSGFFPIAILNLSRKSSNSSEYLICYEEVGIFVDCYGTKTRPEDIKWKQQIFSIAYKEPFLYIVYFNKVEVIHLKDSSYTREKNDVDTSSDVLSLDDKNIVLPDSFEVPLINPSLLGTRDDPQILYVLCRSTEGQKIVEVSGVELHGVRRRLSDSSQDSVPSTSTEDPTGNRPPLDMIDGLSDVADSDSLIASLDSALEAIDSTSDSQSNADGSFKRPSSGSTRYDKKRVKFRE